MKENETNSNNKNLENKESTNNNNNNEAKIFSEQNNESNKNININLKAEQNKNDSSIEDINLDDLDKEEQEEEKEQENIKEENINENLNKIKEIKNDIINNNNNNNDINKKEEEDKEKEIDENIEVVEENKNDIENQEVKYGFNGEKTASNDQINSAQAQTQNERYSLEENIYDNLRLTKSLGGEYLHQNMEKFDIEYMCRCLSLAIMKLLESGKGKQHITDLMDKENEKFEFFNNFFNTNYNIISDFFGRNKNNNETNDNNIENKMSNLEKLEIEQNKVINDNENINLLKHLKKDIDEKLIKDQEIKNKQYKLKNNLADIEKDIKFIDEFFSMNRQRTKNYKGLTDKTKNIMSKELSYINEVDSEANNTKTASMISNIVEKNNNNLSKQSKEEEKKEIENYYYFFLQYYLSY